MKRYKIFLAVMFSAVIFLLTACTGVKQKTEEQKAENSMFAMNTFMTFQAYGENAKSALEETKDYIIDLENMRSVTREESDIYTANHSNGAEIVIQKETADLLSFALQMAEQTNGALSTSLYVMGRKEAENYWRNHGGFDMLLITNENEVIVTAGIAEQFALSKGRTEKVTVLEK